MIKKTHIMKNYLLYSALAVAPMVSAQDTGAGASGTTPTYNRSSLELGVGISNPMAPMALGAGIVEFPSVNLGFRRMFNERFGIKFQFGYDLFKSPKDASAPNEFTTHYLSFTTEAVGNLGKVFNFDNWAPNFGALLHVGGGLSVMSADEIKLGEGGDMMITAGIGVTPQFKISEKAVIHLDLSVYGNMFQGLTFDMRSKTTHGGLNGYLIRFTGGLTYYLGKNAQHADWFIPQPPKVDLTPLENRVKKMEEDMQDGDADGVPNYLDLEPQTEAGATVNTHGQKVEEKLPEVNMGGNGTLDSFRDLFFTVQLGVYSHAVPADVMKNISPLDTKTMPDGKIRYFAGVYHSVEEATAKLEEARKAGIQDAFITAYYKGQRITVAEAKAFLLERGPGILQPKP